MSLTNDELREELERTEGDLAVAIREATRARREAALYREALEAVGRVANEVSRAVQQP